MALQDFLRRSFGPRRSSRVISQSLNQSGLRQQQNQEQSQVLANQSKGFENKSADLKNQLLQQLLGGEGVFAQLFGGGSGGGLGGGLSQPGGPDDGLGGGQNDLFSQFRQGRQQQINQDFDQSGLSQVANLQSRGLGSSTLSNNVQTGNQRERERAFTDLDTNIADRKINFQQQQQQQRQGLLQSLLGGLF